METNTSSKLTAQLTQLRIDSREVHDNALLELQKSAVARIDGELQERIRVFTKEVDAKKEKTSLYALQLFNKKAIEVGNQTPSHSKIIKCLEFSTNGCAESEEHRILADEGKLNEMATNFLSKVNAYYCHKVDSFILDTKSTMCSSVEDNEHVKGAKWWII